jgi:hypothetical protein
MEGQASHPDKLMVARAANDASIRNGKQSSANLAS